MRWTAKRGCLMSDEIHQNRKLTTAEYRLVSWMLEHAGPDAQVFLPQLAQARARPWTCPCGCASLAFAVNGHPASAGTSRPIADFLFGSEHDLSGVFVYEQAGTLAGLSVYGLAGEPPESLPPPESLHEF